MKILIYPALALVLSVLTIESFTYLGFVAKHFYIPAFLFYPLILLGSRITYSKPMQKFAYIITSLTILAFIVLSLLESFHYQNYVYSQYHVNLIGLGLLVCAFILLSSFCYTEQLVRGGLVASIIFFGITNFVGLVPLLVNKLSPVMSSPLASYDQKMEAAYPGFYTAMQQVKKLTPDHAIILIPPQASPWVTEGNDALVRRFLYPRDIAHYDPTSVVSDNFYILIARGSWPADDPSTYGWPKVKINGKKIWHFDGSNIVPGETNSYDPSINNWQWGLIEVAP